MDYFRPYATSGDEAILAAWDSQLAEISNHPGLVDALARSASDLFPRFAAVYADLRRLPRGARRVLQRRLAESSPASHTKLATPLAGAALLLALGSGVGEAATIVVNTTVPTIN